MTDPFNPDSPGGGLPVLSVGEISQATKRSLESQFDHVRVRGEISGFKRAASGHLYLSLKDENAVLDAVCWRGTAGRLGLAPEDGMEVIATGRITSYPGRSKYQIVVEALEVAGLPAAVDRDALLLTIRQVVDANVDNILPLCIAMAAFIRAELDRLRSQKPNDPDLLESYNAQVQMLEVLAEGLEGIAKALEGVTSREIPEEKLEEASGIVADVAEQFRVFWDKRKEEVVEWCVTIPAMAGGVALLNLAGADMLISTSVVAALVGGKKVADVLKEYKGGK